MTVRKNPGNACCGPRYSWVILRGKEDPGESDLRTTSGLCADTHLFFLTLVHPVGYIISIALRRGHNCFPWNEGQEVDDIFAVMLCDKMLKWKIIRISAAIRDKLRSGSAGLGTRCRTSLRRTVSVLFTFFCEQLISQRQSRIIPRLAIWNASD